MPKYQIFTVGVKRESQPGMGPARAEDMVYSSHKEELKAALMKITKDDFTFRLNERRARIEDIRYINEEDIGDFVEYSPLEFIDKGRPLRFERRFQDISLQLVTSA